MILSDEEIIEFKNCHFYMDRYGESFNFIDFARAIEAKVLEKLSDKLRDAERYRWLRRGDNDELVLQSYAVPRDPQMFLPRKEMLDQAIDAAIKESK